MNRLEIEITKLRNVPRFFAHLLGTEAISSHVLSCIRLTMDEATPHVRTFVRNLFRALLEHLDCHDLQMLLTDPNMQESVEWMFPRDSPSNLLFCIKFFTFIKLGNLTEHLKEYLGDNVRV